MYVIVRRPDSPVVAPSFRTNSPSVIHHDLADAKAEALRLAAQNINSYFDVFSLVRVGDALGKVTTAWNETHLSTNLAQIEKPVRIHSHSSKRK